MHCLQHHELGDPPKRGAQQVAHDRHLGPGAVPAACVCVSVAYDYKV